MNDNHRYRDEHAQPPTYRPLTPEERAAQLAVEFKGKNTGLPAVESLPDLMAWVENNRRIGAEALTILRELVRIKYEYSGMDDMAKGDVAWKAARVLVAGLPKETT